MQSSKSLSPVQGLEGKDFKNNPIRTQVLDRPEMFIGTKKIQSHTRWLFDIQTNSMIYDSVESSLAFERIFQEILYNASDNVIRSRKFGFNPKEIELEFIDDYIIVTNYGSPIPITKTKNKSDEEQWVPEMIFNEEFSGSNLDDSIARQGSGVNGIGAKATNILSKVFEIYIKDAERHLSYTQSWQENKHKDMMSKAEILPYKGKESVTTIRFLPDYKYFSMKGLSKDLFQVFCAYAIFISFTVKIPVIINGKRYDFSDIELFSTLFFTKSENTPIIHQEFPKELFKEILDKKVDGISELTLADKKKFLNKVKKWEANVEIFIIPTLKNSNAIAFTNGLFNDLGGVHVDKVYKELSKTLLQEINKKTLDKLIREKEKDGKKPTPSEIKNKTITLDDFRKYVSIIINVNVNTPIFDSQSKNKLISPESKISFSTSEMKVFDSWPVKKMLESDLAYKSEKIEKIIIKENDKSKMSKANMAGKSPNCSLYGAEGASAKGYLDTLISLLPGGKDYAGIIEFKGKTLNVLKASRKKIADNKELSALLFMTKIDINLSKAEREDYYLNEANFAKLHYSRFVIVTDADVDGYHIKGLLINFFNEFAPSLIKRGYVQSLLTPLIRLDLNGELYKFYILSHFTNWMNEYKEAHDNYVEINDKITNLSAISKKSKDQILSFNESVKDLELVKWAKTKPDNLSYKYFKGLGTSSIEEIKQDFSTQKSIEYVLDFKADFFIQLAFNIEDTDKRKYWVGSKTNEYTDIQLTTKKEIVKQDISNFINTELILFSKEDIYRSIPALMDGLKESQRKIVFACFKKWNIGHGKKYSEIKVSQFSSYTADISNYHHGDINLHGVVVKMAQKFIGTNNSPLFNDKGNFGSRIDGGKNPAAGRYIDATPHMLFSYIFRAEDSPYLDYKFDDGNSIEPVVFMPVIPLCLVNGASGIGTGWSTTIPNYNPLEICHIYKQILTGNDIDAEIEPWYLGFTGTTSISESAEKVYNISGERENDKIKRNFITRGIFTVENNRIIITQLPHDKNAEKYFEFLDDLRKIGKIKSIRNLSGMDRIYFEIDGWDNGPVNFKNLGIESSTSLNNLVLLEDDQTPFRYETARDILYQFFIRRLAFYTVRKNGELKRINELVEIAKSKIKLIESKISGELKIDNIEREIIYQKLEELQIPIEIYKSMSLNSFDKKGIEIQNKNLNDLLSERKRIYNEDEKETFHRELGDFENAYMEFLEVKAEQERNFYSGLDGPVVGKKTRKTKVVKISNRGK